jgi:hypothetical protein
VAVPLGLRRVERIGERLRAGAGALDQPGPQTVAGAQDRGPHVGSVMNSNYLLIVANSLGGDTLRVRTT